MVVVADTSVLLNLCRIRREGLLAQLFAEVWIPPAVRDEFLRLARERPRFLDVRLPDWIRCSGPVRIGQDVTACPGLDPGEAEALALALEMHADFVLLDDQAARHAARLLNQPHTGLAGLLLRAKAAGLLEAIAPVLLDLTTEAGFFLSPPVYREMLTLAGEDPDA